MATKTKKRAPTKKGATAGANAVVSAQADKPRVGRKPRLPAPRDVPVVNGDAIKAMLEQSLDEIRTWGREISSRRNDDVFLRALFRQFVAHYKLRIAYQRAVVWNLIAPDSRILTDQAVHYLSSYFNLKRVTIYGWMSEAGTHATISWDRFLMLLVVELSIGSSKQSRIADVLSAEGERYLSVMREQAPKRTGR